MSPDCDLPENLKGKNHDDWIWPLSKIPRGFNAFGPRCSGWRKVPILLIGYNCTRWMDSGDKIVLKINWMEGLKIGGISKPEYGPSPLQKFSKWGFSLVWPLHFEFHYIFASGQPFLFRIGARWDSYDQYYNVWFGYIGFHWN